MQQKGKVSWEDYPDIVNGIASIGGEGNDKAKNLNNRCKLHGKERLGGEKAGELGRDGTHLGSTRQRLCPNLLY